MSYQVLARKWRPQRFDDVVGQQAVTRTLTNAIASNRIAQAFVFAGPRGCGKTTTARILARALNCVQGPAAEPCGVCEPCVEIAQGRDMDVLEIDAASHTGIDNIREVVIAGLGIAPVRNRYKVFIIDEVHQLSSSSFNALLKSIEEPPPHVVFMMATTELQKIPDTILSRAQVFEFRTIPLPAIVAQLRRIADAERLTVSDAALALVARSADGSMRDAQSAFDQAIAFAGQTVTVEDVSTVLGLVGRDLLFDLLDAIVAEDAPAAFALTDRATETGQDLRLVCRELASTVRDLMLVSIDPGRAGDGTLADGERERLTALAARFSREDLLRAFDVLARAEKDIQYASHPRYHFEMALLRWMHLRKLVPLTDLIAQLGGGGARGGTSLPSRPAAAPAGTSGSRPAAAPSHPPASTVAGRAATARRAAGPPPAGAAAPASASPAAGTPVTGAALKDALLAEIKGGKAFFFNTVVAQAQRIDVDADRATFAFLPAHRALRTQFEQTRPWLEAAAERLAGRKVPVVAVEADTAAVPASDASAADAAATPAPAGGARDLRAEALTSAAVQAMLDVFPAEIRTVEEIE